MGKGHVPWARARWKVAKRCKQRAEGGRVRCSVASTDGSADEKQQQIAELEERAVLTL